MGRRKKDWRIPVAILVFAVAIAIAFSAYNVLDRQRPASSRHPVAGALVAHRSAPSPTITWPPAPTGLPSTTAIPRKVATLVMTSTEAPIATIPEATPTTEHSPFAPSVPPTATQPAPRNALIQGAWTLATAQLGAPPAANDPMIVAFTRDLTLIRSVCGVGTITAVDAILRVTSTMRGTGAAVQTIQTANGLVSLLVNGNMQQIAPRATSICQGLFRNPSTSGISLAQHGGVEPLPTLAITLKHQPTYKGNQRDRKGEKGNNGD